MNKRKGRRAFAYACCLPAMILFAIFMIYPTINIFRMSLYKWGGYTANKTFVGFENFAKLFKDTRFLQSMQNTLLLIVIVTIVTLSLAIFYASVLQREKIKGSNFFRIIFYIPNILSVVIISAVFSAIYDVNNGTLNSLISLFSNREPILWLGNSKIIMYSLAFAMIWQAIGYYMVMYMSSIAAIPESIYESAKLDGSSRTKQLFGITIPLIWTNIRTTLTFFIISTINLSFQFVKAMTNGGPNGSSSVFLSYMYDQAYTNSSYGYGMAIGAIIFIFSFALSAVVSAVTKREPIEF